MPRMTNGASARGGASTVGEKIRRLREARGWSQSALGRRVGVEGQSVHRWEAGRTTALTVQTGLRLAQVLEVSPYWLFLDESADIGDPTEAAEATCAAVDAFRATPLGKLATPQEIEALRDLRFRRPTVDLIRAAWTALRNDA